MNIFSRYFTLLAALALSISCSNKGDSVEIPEPEEPNKTIVVSLPTATAATRIALGDKKSSEYPIYWSDNDCLSVNGCASNSIDIDSNEFRKATFTFDEGVLYPCSITYPYTSSSTADSPKVVFLAEQEYVENSFSPQSAPMYGYAEEEKESISLKHLSYILRLEMIAKAENIGLATITITSENNSALAGEFTIDTKLGKLAPTENTTNSVTYTLPEDYTLSTTEKNTFYISLPVTVSGTCVIDFTTRKGYKMTMKWDASGIKAGVVREFKAITFVQNKSGMLEPLDVMEDTFTHRYPTIYGYIHDTNKQPIKGVAVSDGFTVTTTDESGFYKIDVSEDAWHIFISVPSKYKIPTNSKGLPCFFQPYPGFSEWFNFTLEELEGGVENEFMLFGFADPQVSKMTHIERFLKQPAPEVKSYAQSLGLPCYGITLGDVISMGSTDLTNTVLPAMRDAMHQDNMGMPVFQVMGNHDNCYMTANHPVPGDNSRELNLNIQRLFETTFGPINYSFNRGNAHIVGMRDIQWSENGDASVYKTAFTEEQYKWLMQDLACVENKENNVVVLCVHIPLYNSGSIGDGTYRQEVLSLLDEFGEAHVLSGHLHYMRNYDHTLNSKSKHKIYEHAQAAFDGASWTSNINGDGVPNGYGVYHFDGGTIKDWYYKGYAEGMNSRDYQIRLYRGNTITGAAIPEGDANKNKTKGFYQFGYSDDILLANVFNSDTAWKVEVYENGEYSGEMTSLAQYHFSVSYDQLIGSYVYDDPKRPPVGVECGCDFWAVGILCGYLGMNNGGLYYKHCYQLWKYQLKDKNAKVEVRATDRKGNVYTCSTITDGRDMTYALYNK